MIILKETDILTVAGGVTGVLFSTPGSGFFGAFVRSIMPYVPSGRMIRFEPLLAVRCILFSNVIGKRGKI